MKLIIVIILTFIIGFLVGYTVIQVTASDLPKHCQEWHILDDSSWCLDKPLMVVSGGEKTYNDSRFNPTLIEKERELKQNLKLENEDLKKKLEEAKLLIETWNKKEKHCDDLQSRYNQIYLIVNN